MNRSPGVACGSQTAWKPYALDVNRLILTALAYNLIINFQKEEMY